MTMLTETNLLNPYQWAATGLPLSACTACLVLLHLFREWAHARHEHMLTFMHA